MIKRLDPVYSLIVLLILVLCFCFSRNVSLTSDSTYYAQISRQITNSQDSAFSLENMESRPVQYPQLFFLINSIFSNIFGDDHFKILLFFITLFICLSLLETYKFKDRKTHLIFISSLLALFFSSSLFYLLLRYKIESFLFLIIFSSMAIFSKNIETDKKIFLVSFFIGIGISLKQTSLIFLLVIPIVWYAYYKFRKFDKLLIGLIIVFLTSFPFYLANKAATNYFSATPSVKFPIIDGLKINLKNVEKTKFYFENLSVNKFRNNGSYSFKNNYQKALSNFLFRNSLLNKLGLPFLIVSIFLIRCFFLFKKERGKIFTLLLLSTFSLISFIKIIKIWTYFTYANFLLELTFFYFWFKFLKKYNTKYLYLLSAIIVISSMGQAKSIYKTIKNANKRVNYLVQYKNYVPENSYVLTNRPYEIGYYFPVKVISSQYRGFDYLSEGDKDSRWYFLEKTFFEKKDSFLNTAKERGIGYVILMNSAGSKFIDYQESVNHFKNADQLNTVLENKMVSIYQLK